MLPSGLLKSLWQGPKVNRLDLSELPRRIPRNFEGNTFRCAGLLHNSWPPVNELSSLFPVRAAGPGALQHEYRQVMSAEKLPFGPVPLSECVLGNNRPLATLLAKGF